MLDGAAAPRPAPLIFSNADLPERSRLEAWNAAFGRLNEISLLDPDAPALARGMHWDLGGAVIGHNRITATRFRRDLLRAQRDGLDHWVIRVLMRGACRMKHDGFTTRVTAGQPVLFSMHEAWLCEWSDAEWVSVTLPRDHDPDLSRQLGARAPGPLRGPAAALLGSALAALPEQLAAAQHHELPVLAERLRELLHASLMPGLAADENRARRQSARDVILRRMASARLTPERLAAEIGLSRSALYRLFEGEGGVARQIQAIRLDRAREALRDPARRGESVAAIGAAHGFPDPAVFSRSFRRAFGMPPGAARGEVPAAAAPARETPAPRDLAQRLYAPRAGSLGC
jgi:AraC-like DNA-binding protein